jgi:hypothetical protein
MGKEDGRVVGHRLPVQQKGYLFGVHNEDRRRHKNWAGIKDLNKEVLLIDLYFIWCSSEQVYFIW